MLLIEATGEAAACARCGRAAPGTAEQGAEWGSLFVNGRLVQLTCPRCQTTAEREEIARRRGAELTEVASARRAGRDELERIVAEARAAGRIAPGDDWLAQAGGGEDLGVLTGAADGGWALAVWSNPPALLELRIADWMALEEHFVPYGIQAAAAEWARRQLNA